MLLRCLHVYRKDSKDGYGGVLTAVRKTLISQHVSTDSETELIAVQILCKHNTLTILNAYRPTDNNKDYAKSLSSLVSNSVNSHPKDCIWLVGDLNLPDID